MAETPPQRPDPSGSPPPPAPPPRAGRWTRILLFVSLAANLLIVGLVAGAILGGPRDRVPQMRDVGLGPFAAALPREDRRALAEALRREAGPFRENRAALRRQFQALLAALRADPYDPAALEALVATSRARIADRQALAQDLLLERLAQMSAAERAAYADALEEALRRGPRRRNK